MADSTELHVWEQMAKNFKDKEPYEDSGFIEFLKSHTKLQGRFLDVGCSLGLFDQIFVDAGFQVLGVDQIEYAINLAKKKVPKANYLTISAEDIRFFQEFEVVLTHTVLQHMQFPIKNHVLQNIFNALKPGGVFFMGECTFTKDNWHSVEGRPEFTKESSDGYSYTEKGWKVLLQSLGFEFLEKHKEQDWYVFRKP